MLFLTFLIGFFTSYLGMVTPSMLNITAIKLSIKRGEKEATNYAYGVALVVFFQGVLALYFLKILYKNPLILATIEQFAALIFAVLSFFFFRKAFLEKKQLIAQEINRPGFITGIGLSFLNMFSVPFYCIVGTIASNYGWLDFTLNSVAVFMIGSTLGTFFILYHYVQLAQRIHAKIAFLTNYINAILGIITGIVALLTFVKLL